MSNDTRPETTDDDILLTDTRLEYLPSIVFIGAGIGMIGLSSPALSVTLEVFTATLLIVFGVTDGLGTFMKRRGQ